MEALPNKRRPVKATITRIENFITENSKNAKIGIVQFTEREQELREAFNKYKEIQDEIEALDALNNDKEDMENLEVRYYSMLKILQDVVTLRKSETTENSPNLSQCSSFSNNTSTFNSKLNVKLPEINIQTFTGIPSEWQAFFEIFTALITKNTRLSDSERFIYLKGLLKNEPLNLINNLQLTGDNFKIAIEILEKRYSNKLAVINCHIKNLLEIPFITKCNAHNLRDFITLMKQNVVIKKFKGTWHTGIYF